MPVKLGAEVAAKIKADFPALTINQIAQKYGVAWATAHAIVNPQKDGAPAGRPKHRGQRKVRASTNGHALTIELTDKIADSWFVSLTLEEKAALMRGR